MSRLRDALIAVMGGDDYTIHQQVIAEMRGDPDVSQEELDAYIEAAEALNEPEPTMLGRGVRVEGYDEIAKITGVVEYLDSTRMLYVTTSDGQSHWATSDKVAIVH